MEFLKIMKCFHPRWFMTTSSKYGVSFWYPRPCGKCDACRINRAQEWTYRLVSEARDYGDNMCFVTLTYDNEHLPQNGSLVVADVQKFIKRVRKVKPVRYYLCGEYGEHFSRPHYHVILFGVSFHEQDFIQSKWPFGFVSVKSVNIKRFHYVAGYVQKKLYGKAGQAEYASRKLLPEFSLMSKKPLIGSCYYTEEQIKKDIDRGYGLFQGHKVAIPRSFRRRYESYEQFMAKVVQLNAEFAEYRSSFEALKQRFSNPVLAVKFLQACEAQREFNSRRRRQLKSKGREYEGNCEVF